MGFGLVPKSMTLSDLERLDGRHHSLISHNTAVFGANWVQFIEAVLLEAYCQQQSVAQRAQF